MKKKDMVFYKLKFKYSDLMDWIFDCCSDSIIDNTEILIVNYKQLQTFNRLRKQYFSSVEVEKTKLGVF